MPVLSNQRHEAFARAIAEGKSATAAYKQAGYETDGNSAEVNASRLLRNAKVQDRVREMQETAVERTLVTIESLTNELEQARVLAMADEKGASAAVSAVMGKAKLHGLLIDKGEQNVTIRHEDWLDSLEGS